MGKRFKIGDKVRRIKESHAGMEVGDVGTVVSVNFNGQLIIKEFLGECGYVHDPDNFELVKDNNMKKFKNKLAVTGSKSLLKAFKEELINLGYDWEDYSIKDCDYIVVNTVIKGQAYYNQTHGRADIKLFLPQDWDKSLKLAAEVEEEIPEYVECIIDNYRQFTKGKIYQVDINRSSSTWYSLFKDDKGLHNGWGKNHFKPSTKEAFEEQNKPRFREGDWLYGKSHMSVWIFKFKSYDSKRDKFVTDETYQIAIDLGELLHEGESDNWASLSTVRLATDEEIKRILTKVAEIKYPIGTKIRPRNLNMMIGSPKDVKVMSNTFRFGGGSYQLWTDSGQWNSIIYENGQWAEIVKDPELVINGYEVVKFTSNTVKIGCQTFHKDSIELMRRLLNGHGGTYVFKDNTKWTANDLDKILSVFD